MAQEEPKILGVLTGVVEDYKIRQCVQFEGTSEQIRQQTVTWIVDTRDKQVREALLKMGWTPPECEPKYLVNQPGKDLCAAWVRATQDLEYRRRDVAAAVVVVEEAAAALAEWLLPKDAKPGETIAVWFGHDLIQCKVGLTPATNVLSIRPGSK